MLRAVNAILYLAFAVFAVATLARPLRSAFAALVSRFAYAPELTLPWLWLALAALVALALADTLRHLAMRRRAGLARYGAIIVLSVAAFAARKLVEPAVRPTVVDALGHLVARAELAADRAFAKAREYPVDPAVLGADYPLFLRSLGYWRRGAVPLESRVVVVEHALEPAFRAPEGVRPGDVVFALDSRRERYWITAFVLDRRGRLAPLVDARGRVIVASGASGRASSRLDPLFPEYPKKVPPAPGAAAPRSP